MSDSTNEEIQKAIEAEEATAAATGTIVSDVVPAVSEDASEVLNSGAQILVPEVIMDKGEEKVPWYKKLHNWLVSAVKRLFKIVFTGVGCTAAYIINNSANQDLAAAAVKKAIAAGLKGDKAWDAAMEILNGGTIYISDTAVVKATDVKENIRDTLLQLVYMCIRNGVKVAVK